MKMARQTFNLLPASDRSAAVTLLNKLLATSTDLSIQAKHAHWNVSGCAFIAVHELFDRVNEESRDWADTIAERIAALGGMARGTLQAAAGATSLPTMTSGLADQQAYCTAIAKGLARFSADTVAAIDTLEDTDCVTANMLQDIARAADKLMFLVERHVGA